MSGWPDLVTTALLGTDRRPIPDELDLGWGPVDVRSGAVDVAANDSAALVLALAASRHVATRAGSPLQHSTAPPQAQGDRLPLAPPPAQDLLAGLLVKPEPGLVNEWLGQCAARGLGAAVEMWPRLAALAARNTAYDRTLLASTVGPRGRWFFSRNPAWARLSDPADAEPPTAPPDDPEAALSHAEHSDSPPQAMEMVLACSDPLSTPLVLAGLRLVATGVLGADTRAGAGKLAYRIPLSGWSDLGELVGSDERPRQPVPATMMRTVQFSLDLIERIVRARIEINEVFSATPPAATLEKGTTP